uniref:Uncharacterized protein n=1 Tax=Corethron hystrix TaxID=216773 RepID=A0A7S1BC40_9STRA
MIIDELRNVGVTVLSVGSGADVFAFLDAVTLELPSQRCLLYTDNLGRVFNVVVSGGTRGLNSAWETALTIFCGWEACLLIPMLTRCLACSDTITVEPGFLLLLFGFVFNNETSMTWLATTLLIRGTPSVGAYVWHSSVLTDYPRDTMLLIFAVAQYATNEKLKQTLYYIGIVLALLLVTANLGARAWKKLNLGVIDNTTFAAPILGCLGAIAIGLVFPYLGMRSVNGGGEDSGDNNGRLARQYVTLASTFTILVYYLTDYAPFVDALGLRYCAQASVNVAVGSWWTLATVASLSVCHKIQSAESKIIEPFLKSEPASPVGWVVPSLPNIVIDPQFRGEPYNVCCAWKSGSELLSVILVLGCGGIFLLHSVLQLKGDSIWYFGQLVSFDEDRQ